MEKKYRYPGSQPFSADNQRLFFGRGQEIERLASLIRIEPLVVLYGKSGLGKSSLLNAGVVPQLKGIAEYEPVQIRFRSYMPNSDLVSPLERSLQVFRRDRNTNSFLRKIYHNNHSLWYSCKSASIASGHAFVFIFDQFEELFTYPEAQINEFAAELALLLSKDAQPTAFRNALKEALLKNQDVLTNEELALIQAPMNIHCIMGIRSDKMSLLNRLSPYIPNILRNLYELHPMTPEQAEEAITLPALLDNEAFASPRFDYTDETLDKILSYLTKGNEKNIETFQLQILCQYIEQQVVLGKVDLKIDPEDVGNPEEIYQNYYDTQISTISNQQDREKAMRLIEEGLILESEGRRLSLYEGQIKTDYGISDELLKRLVDSHLIRSEPDSKGAGFSYEISHDTLVAPILRSKERRLAQEISQQHEREREEKRQQLAKRTRTRIQLVGIVFLMLATVLSLYLMKDAREAKDHAEMHRQEAEIKAKEVERQKDVLDSLYKSISEEERFKYLVDNGRMKTRIASLVKDSSRVHAQLEQHRTSDNQQREKLKQQIASLNQRIAELKEGRSQYQEKIGAVIEEMRINAKEIYSGVKLTEERERLLKQLDDLERALQKID